MFRPERPEIVTAARATPLLEERLDPGQDRIRVGRRAVLDQPQGRVAEPHANNQIIDQADDPQGRKTASTFVGQVTAAVVGVWATDRRQ